jgi:hypothetical protein
VRKSIKDDERHLVEHRYIADIVNGIQADGLEVR